MSASELGTPVTDQLLDLAAADHLSFLLGAGASVAAGLPDWDTLATRLLVKSEAIDDEETARAFLALQDPALAAEAARASTDDWPGLLRAALYGDSDEPVPGPSGLHLATASFAAQHEPGAVGLFTLNFDLLLERALELAVEEMGTDRGIFTRSSAQPRAKSGTYEIHHLHGVVPPTAEPQESVILALSDFTALPPRPWQVSALQEATQHGPLVLAGTSYRDPDVRQWMHDLTNGDGVRTGHRPVVLLAREGLGLTKTQFGRVHEAIVGQWSAIGVHSIPMHDYADAAQAIRELPFLNSSDYRSPQQRCRELVEVLTGEFSEAQQRHSEQLSEDLARLREHLGEEANLTLWLADGEGGLIRWAAPDRTYRSAQQLRRVPIGHDSPWIAGQCLAIDDISARETMRDPGDLRRWRSVVASPIVVSLPGGPPMAAAALSSATPEPLATHDIDAWSESLALLADEWGRRLGEDT